jgi:hypothetical protein
MSNIDVSALLTAMLNAAKGPLAAQWPAVRSILEDQLPDFVDIAAKINAGQKEGSISPADAKIFLDMEKTTLQGALTEVETVGLIAAQNAINAALSVLASAVNKAAGIAVL